MIAGNVATGVATKALIEAGVDAVKVGIGPGSICTTRVVAGIGVPQVSAVMDCYEVAREYGIPIIADGGIKYSGECDKGSGCRRKRLHDGKHVRRLRREPGNLRALPGKKNIGNLHGMGSIAAMENGSKDRYFQSDAKKLVPEGVEGRVAYKGICGGYGVPDVRRLKSRNGLLRRPQHQGAPGEQPVCEDLCGCPS